MTPLQLLLHNPLQSIAALLLLFGVLFFPILLLIPLSIYFYRLSRVERVTPYKHNYDYIPTRKSNQFMSPSEKAAYLQSDEWKALRQLVLERDNHQCVVSGATTQLEVHHITYERLGAERLSDLVVLSRPVHQHLHDLLGYDRTTDFSLEHYYLCKANSNFRGNL